MADPDLRLLVVGGYGTFGGRLVDLLCDEPRLTMLVAGRDATRAAAFCASRRTARARLEPVRFDREGDLQVPLSSLAPDVVVDASGPFQDYGARRYRLIEACIEARVNYLDLADGSGFVDGVAAFDAAARDAGIYVLSGVSSFPVLTAAVVRHLAARFDRVVSIRGGIAPSPFAGVGENVIRAIAGYAGKPLRTRHAGRTTTAYAFTDTQRMTIAPPGKRPLGNLLFALVDVPDLQALTVLWPDAREVWMGAAPVPELLHRVLIGLAWLVRWRLLPTLAPLARLMYVVMNHVRWGEHRGGMFVSVAGTDRAGQPRQLTWHLLAEGDDGPLIPSMAVEALVRRTLAGRQPAPGARAAVRELELADYDALFARRAISTGVRDDGDDTGQPLFQQLLGRAWEQLPPAVRTMHDGPATRQASGRCVVERGSGLLANAVAALFRFPRAAADLSVTVRFQCGPDTERWTRTFGRDVFPSVLKRGQRRTARLLVERIGLFEFAQALVVEGDRLRLELCRWSLFQIPLPRWLAPQSDSYETEVDGRFCFHVDISHPWLGRLVRYRGWLVPSEGTG